MDSINLIDTAVLPKAQAVAKPSRPGALGQVVVSWLGNWEVYPLLAVAFFLHFYQLTTTQFDADQAILFRLPRTAVVSGLIPATGTVASIGMINPPGYVYLLMPVAVFTASPWADVLFTAFLNTLAVLLTYLFTRRYYGRIAGTVAALLYTTTFWDLFFGRFIWQPNLFPFFTLLFLFALFRGAVERKAGWLTFALPLLGFMFQLHTVAAYVGLPLLLTVVLAYKTVRWRDVVIGLFLFLLCFATYIIWEVSTHFADLQILLHASGGVARVDNQAFTYFKNFLAPYVGGQGDTDGVLAHLIPLLHWERRAIYAVTLGGFLLAALGLSGWKRVQVMVRPRFEDRTVSVNTDASSSLWRRFWNWWQIFTASPPRCGLLLLLSWQIPPLLFMSRHTVDLQPQYFLILLPGPFILIGLLVSQVSSWCGQIQNLGRIFRLAVPALSLLMVALQFAGSLAWFHDEGLGHHLHGDTYDTWQDVQGAVVAADQLAQSRHLHHVYIDTDSYTFETLHYLAGQMQTPVTVLNTSNCLILPALAQGPAVMLLGPADTLDTALLKGFASATLVSEPSRLGGPPFQLYIVQSLSATPESQKAFTNTLALGASRPGAFTWNDPDHPDQPTRHLFETVWTNLKSWPVAAGTMYTYHFAASYSGNGTDGETGSADCGFSSLAPGDQLLVPFNLPAGSAALPTALTLGGSTWISEPDVLNYGPFRFESIQDRHYLLANFQASSGGSTLAVQN